jgi:hypothetical protein
MVRIRIGEYHAIAGAAGSLLGGLEARMTVKILVFSDYV